MCMLYIYYIHAICICVFSPEPFQSCRHHVPLPQILHCLFPKNKDLLYLLLYNHNIMIKFRKYKIN